MKRVYIAKDPTDAHLLMGLLEGANIEAVVRGEFLYGVRGEVPITEDTCPSVWIVNDSDYDQASGLVSAFREGAPPIPEETGVWHCRCGEENENRFTECWRCGRSRKYP